MRFLIRSFAAAVGCGLIGAAILAAAYVRDSGLTFEMNSTMPDFVSGMHGVERDGSLSFAWTSGQVSIDLRSLGRRSAWSCTLRLRAYRPDGLAMPTVTVLVDDARVTSVPAAPDFHDVGFTIPAGRTGPRLTIDVDPTFVPGPADKRVLGVQIDRLNCRPAALAFPPSSALLHVAVAAGYTALIFSFLGFSVFGSMLCGAAVAGGISLLLTQAGAIYGDYSTTVVRITIWATLVPAALMTSVQRAGGNRLTAEARAAFAVASIALLVKLIALMHPAKPVIDAMFHAHRLDRVIGGEYFFTQPFVGDVQMPYAIGLYVFAWPWTWFTSDHMALIRTVAAASDVAAGLLLYPMVARLLNDRRAGALAVLFYQLAPLPYALLGNANLTNMFGQSVALAVVAAAVLWHLSPYRPFSLLAFTALVTWAFCSHVSTVTMLLATLGGVTILYYWRGDRSRREAAVAIAIAVVAALAISWLIYYRHLSGEMAAAVSRMFSGGASTTPATAEEAARGFMSVSDRLRYAVVQTGSDMGWPIAILAAVGTWSLWRRGERDRLVSALLAWAAMWLIFSASTIFSRVDQEFVRYATEFLGRINLAVLPMVAVLAGRGGTQSGRGLAVRAMTYVLIAWSIVIAVQSLLAWFDR